MEQNNIYKTVFKVTHSGGSGSCFYLKAYDLFVTNYHVTEGFRTVAIHDNERNPYLAKVVLANPAMDIALLAAEGDFSSLPDISLAEDDTLTIGRKVYVAGYPYGMPFTITEGSVSSPKQLMDGKYYIQTDAAVNPGNSGGPILDEDNRVVGVTVSKFTQADNMGFGIRVETLHALLDTIGDLNRTVFQVQCGSCEELIAQEEEYCPSCGDKLPEGVFEEREQSPLGGFVESAIEQMGVNPVLARDGYDSWLFHKGSSEIRIFVYDNNYLFSTSPINLLPKKEVEPVLDYMLSEDFGPYKLGIEGRQIYIAYRIHLSDITDESEEEIRKNGTTILMVTHDMGSIIKYCDKVVLLNKGEFIAEGQPGHMVDLYKKILANQMDSLKEELESDYSGGMDKEDGKKTDGAGTGNAEAGGASGSGGLMKDKITINASRTEYGDGRAEIFDLGLFDQRGNLTNLLLKGEMFTIKERIRFHAPLKCPIFTYTIKDKKGTDLSGTNTMYEGADVKPVNEGDIYDVSFTQKMTLQGGEYLLSMSCTGFEGEEHVVYHRLYDVANITVISNKNTVGVYDMESEVETKLTRG